MQWTKTKLSKAYIERCWWSLIVSVLYQWTMVQSWKFKAYGNSCLSSIQLIYQHTMGSISIWQSRAELFKIKTLNWQGIGWSYKKQKFWAENGRFEFSYWFHDLLAHLIPWPYCLIRGAKSNLAQNNWVEVNKVARCNIGLGFMKR